MRTQTKQARALERVGFVEFEAARFDRAEEAFRLAAVITPESGDAWLGLGASLAKQQRHEEAALIFGMAAIAAPDDAWPSLLAAEAWLTMGDTGRAQGALECARALQRKDGADRDQLEAADALEQRVRREGR